jgi:hypothetical protein
MLLSRPEGVGRIFRFRHNFNKAVGSEAWRIFCRHGALWRPLLTHGAETGSKAQVQCRGATGSKSVTVMVQELDCKQCGDPGTTPTVILLTARAKRKKRDKFINTTVRVIASALFFKFLERSYNSFNLFN